MKSLIFCLSSVTKCKVLPAAAPKALGMSEISIHVAVKMYSKDLMEFQEWLTECLLYSGY